MSSSMNVKVAVRCRPMSQKETTRGCKSIISMSSTTAIHIEDPGVDSGGVKNTKSDFTFDYVYDQSSTQVQVYKDLGLPIITKALDGFNGTIFAYGQTGSGNIKNKITNQIYFNDPIENFD